MQNESIRHQVESVQDKQEEELYAIIGAYALSQAPSEFRTSIAADGSINVSEIQRVGVEYFEKLRPILGNALCGRDGIASYMERPTVQDIITVGLPALGYTVTGLIPTAVIAVCLIIFRSGVREYCKAYNAEVLGKGPSTEGEAD